MKEKAKSEHMLSLYCTRSNAIRMTYNRHYVWIIRIKLMLF